MLTSIAAPKLGPERGFLPPQDPLRHLPKAFDAWESTASVLPKLFASDRLRKTLEDLPPFPLEAALSDAALNDSERERAMVLLSWLGHAYVWGAAKPAGVLPARLAVPAGAERRLNLEPVVRNLDRRDHGRIRATSGCRTDCSRSPERWRVAHAWAIRPSWRAERPPARPPCCWRRRHRRRRHSSRPTPARC